jgi:MFS family permease
MKLSTGCMYGLNDLTYIYFLIFINGISSSLINLAMSLRAYDISNSASLVAITVMFYNMSYVIASWSLSKLTSKFRSIKNLLATIFAGYVLGVLLMIFNNLYLLFIGGVFIGISSALSSPMLMSILGSYVGKDSLTVARFNLVSTIASVIGYLIGSTSGSNILALEISAVISTPAILIANHIRVDSLTEIKKELHIPQIPITTGNIRSTPTTVQTHKLMYDFKILMYDLIKMFRKGVLRELNLLLIGSVALFTAISTFFSPFPAILKGRGFTDSDVFIMSLTSSIASIIWFRLASRFIKSISDAWSVLIKCVLSRIAIFSIPSLTLTFIDDLKILRLR